MLGNADGSRTCHVHATLGTYLAVPGESVGHALLDVYTEQSPWQPDTLSLISIVDTSSDFPKNGKHSSCSMMTKVHMWGYTIDVGVCVERSIETISVDFPLWRDLHRPG